MEAAAPPPNEEEGASDGGDDSDDRKPAAVVESQSADSLSDQAKSSPRKRKAKDKSNHALRWEEMYNRLCDYHTRCGHANVPNRYSDDPQLGSWVSAQRRAYKTITSGASGSTAMTLERATKLKKLGFEWEAINPNNVPWETRYNELLAFVKKYGHANVPMRWKENVQLSNWVSKQRHDHKLLQRGTSSRLTEKRRKLLNDVGFIWEVERGSSVAQLQRVAVVGLPTRKRKNHDTISDGEISGNNVSRSSTSQQPSSSTTEGTAMVSAGRGSNVVSALSSSSANQEIMTTSATAGPGVAAFIPNVGQALGTFHSAGISSQRTSNDPPGTAASSGVAGNPFLELAHGSNVAATLAGQNQGSTQPPFLGLNAASTSQSQQQQPMIILPILAMMPENQGTVPGQTAPAPQLVPLAPIVHNPSSNNLQAANTLVGLAALLGGNASVTNPTTLGSLGALLGGSSVANLANPLASAGVPAATFGSSPAPSSVGNLQAGLVALASALGTPQHPVSAPAMAPARNASVQTPAVGNQQNQAAMAALSALLGTAGGASIAATAPTQQQLTGSALASMAGSSNLSPAAAPPFAVGGAPAQHTVVNALASTLSQLFDPSALAAAQPQRAQPPAQATMPNEAAQNLASALSHFFQTNPQNASAQQDRRIGDDPREDQPSEKRARLED